MITTTPEDVDSFLKETHSKLMSLCDGMERNQDRRLLEQLLCEIKRTHGYIFFPDK